MGEGSRREQLEDLVQAEPDDVFLRYGLAMEYVGEGLEDKAIEQFDAVLEADPTYVAAYQQLAQLLIGRGRRDRARQVLTDGMVAAERAGDGHAADWMRQRLDLL